MSFQGLELVVFRIDPNTVWEQNNPFIFTMFGDMGNDHEAEEQSDRITNRKAVGERSDRLVTIGERSDQVLDYIEYLTDPDHGQPHDEWLRESEALLRSYGGEKVDPERIVPDWTVRDTVGLTRALDHQAKRNLALVQDQIDRCLTDDTLAEPCRKFLDIVTVHGDLFYRDQIALSPDNPVETYAVVLLYDGRYYGHVFTWLSPVYPTVILMMGIRNRVDTLFIRGTNQELPGVAYLLLEGVRRFAAIKGGSRIVVVAPYPVMIDLLTQVGFTEVPVASEIVGDGVGRNSNEPIGQSFVYSHCYQRGDLLSPIVTNPIRFFLLD